MEGHVTSASDVGRSTLSIPDSILQRVRLGAVADMLEELSIWIPSPAGGDCFLRDATVLTSAVMGGGQRSMDEVTHLARVGCGHEPILHDVAVMLQPPPQQQQQHLYYPQPQQQFLQPQQQQQFLQPQPQQQQFLQPQQQFLQQAAQMMPAFGAGGFGVPFGGGSPYGGYGSYGGGFMGGGGGGGGYGPPYGGGVDGAAGGIVYMSAPMPMSMAPGPPLPLAPPPSAPMKRLDAEKTVQKFKTKICIFWLQPNGCPYADRCLYAHGADQLRSDVTGAPPGSDAEYNERYKTRM